MSAAVEFESGALGYLGGAFITPRRKFFQVHGTEGIILVDQEAFMFLRRYNAAASTA